MDRVILDATRPLLFTYFECFQLMLNTASKLAESSSEMPNLSNDVYTALLPNRTHLDFKKFANANWIMRQARMKTMIVQAILSDTKYMWKQKKVEGHSPPIWLW